MKRRFTKNVSSLKRLTISILLMAFAVVAKGQSIPKSGDKNAGSIMTIASTGGKKIESSSDGTLTETFQGVTYTGVYPPDPVLAAGPSNVLGVVNTYYRVFTKAGTIVYQGDLHNFFNDPSDKLYDPKVVFDQYSQRWVILILADNGQTGYYLLAVSQSSDPNPSLWYKYKLNASVDSNTPSGLRADYPGLGYDANCVYITSNQYSFAAGTFQYAKIRILNKSQIYSGQTPTAPFTDFVNMKDEDGTTSFTVKPVHQFGSSNSYYLIDTKQNGGSAITLWSISNPSTSPVLTRQGTIAVKPYTPPPDASQLGTLEAVGTAYGGAQNETYTQDAMYRNGYLYTSFATAHNYGSGTVSAIQYDKIDVSSNTAVVDDIYGSDGVYYYYPNIYTDAYGDIGLVFCRSSADEYPGVWWTFRTPSDVTLRSPQLLKAGEGYVNEGDTLISRYGDYSGICLDPSNDNQLWFCGEWSTTSHDWDTQIGGFQFPAVEFTNSVGGNIASGSLQVNSTTTITSGSSVRLGMGSNNTELTFGQGSGNQDRFVNTNGLVLAKHNNWDAAASSYLLNNNFKVNGTPGETETAYFIPLNPATITASSVDGANISSLQLQLNDPWYLNSTGSQGNNGQTTIPITQTSSPMTGAYNQGTGGVFTNQSGPPNWTAPYYAVGFPTGQTVSVGGTNHTLYFQNWSASGGTVENPNSASSPVVFTSSNATVTANVKGTELSNDANAFIDNSQRKLVRTSNGWLSQVYTSSINGVEHAWIEHSTNDGTSWFLGNGGHPLDYNYGSSPGSKCPSLDYYNDQYGNIIVAAVFQEPKVDGHYSIYLESFCMTNGNYTYSGPQWVSDEPTNSYSTTDANPNISINNGLGFIVTFEKSTANSNRQIGIDCEAGVLDNGGTITSPLLSSAEHVDGTDNNSANATVYCNKSITRSYSDPYCKIAWEQDNSSTFKQIDYSAISFTYDGSQWIYNAATPQNISSNLGSGDDYRPSIVEMADNTVRVSWITDQGGQPNPPFINVIYWDSNDPYDYGIYDFNTQSVSINATDDGSSCFA